MKVSEVYLHRFQKLHPVLIDLSLGRIEHLLSKMGDPHKTLPNVIHVAGTNGKGSTIAFLRAMLEASGARVHVLTSPHLIHFNERIRLAANGGGKLVTEEQLVESFERVEKINAGDSITFFEITTAVAIDLFVRNPADFVLIEVGLGGRFDATNVFEKPAACVITSISMDHKEFLGDTLAKIALEKAGILKKNVPAIFSNQEVETLEILRKEARKNGVTPKVGGEDFHAFEEGGRLIYQSEDRLLDLPIPRLIGRHQYMNAATAITTMLELAPEIATEKNISKGLLQAQWPARMQRLTGKLQKLLPIEAELWLDGGHNADGAIVAAETMTMLEEKSPRPLILLGATMQRKDAAEILHPFVGIAQEFFALSIPNQEGARKPQEMADVARLLGIPSAICGDISETINFISVREWNVPPRILIFGSLYLAGEILKQDGNSLQ